MQVSAGTFSLPRGCSRRPSWGCVFVNSGLKRTTFTIPPASVASVAGAPATMQVTRQNQLNQSFASGREEMLLRLAAVDKVGSLSPAVQMLLDLGTPPKVLPPGTYLHSSWHGFWIETFVSVMLGSCLRRTEIVVCDAMNMVQSRSLAAPSTGTALLKSHPVQLSSSLHPRSLYHGAQTTPFQVQSIDDTSLELCEMNLAAARCLHELAHAAHVHLTHRCASHHTAV
eukprot:8472721-Pyramimonas_sp.AAC.2